MNVKNRLAIMYDFDETLAPGNMQEYAFIPTLKMSPDEFWSACADFAKQHNMDNILAYMYTSIRLIKENKIKITEEEFRKQGDMIYFFNGVESWFKRINEYGKSLGIQVEHYIISCGLKEILDGTKIAKEFKKIFACRFAYDEKTKEPIWAAQAINYTSKTQYIYRVRKNKLDKLYDAYELNEYVEDRASLLPYTNMIYIGDGETDVPCMKTVKIYGGNSICVYNPLSSKKEQIAKKLFKDGRVNFIAPADYSDKSKLDQIIKDLISKLALNNKIETYILINKINYYIISKSKGVEVWKN